MALTDPRVAIQNFVFSLIRTVVPMGVAWVIGLVTSNFGPIIGDDTKAQLVGAGYVGAAALYYFGARMLETYVAPKFSFLLGDFRKGMTAPVYATEEVPVVIPPAEEDTGNPVPPAPCPEDHV